MISKWKTSKSVIDEGDHHCSKRVHKMSRVKKNFLNLTSFRKRQKRVQAVAIQLMVFFISIEVGFQLTTCFGYTVYWQSSPKNCEVPPMPSGVSARFEENLGSFKFPTKRSLVLVAIMTSYKYFDTRDWSIKNTWLRSIPGDVVFFIGNSTHPAPPGVPLVRLNRVPDNVYPPQGKVFEMLKYLYKNHLDKYEYFIRADDDVFIKGQELGSLLRSVDSREVIYLGHYGQGVPAEKGKLGMGTNFWYCIGGPTVIFSRTALERLAPNLDRCKGDTATFHEDTELGRCVERFLKVQCKSSRKIRKIFYQNYREVKGTFSHELGQPELHAVTLHPVKNVSYMFRLKVFFQQERLRELASRISKIQPQVHKMERSLKASMYRRKNIIVYRTLHDIEMSRNGYRKDKLFWNDSGDENDGVENWDFTESLRIHSLGNIHQAPRQNLDVKGNVIGLEEAMKALWGEYSQDVDHIKLKRLLYAYRRLLPNRGLEHLLHVHLLQKGMPNGYLNATFLIRQTFRPLVFREDAVAASETNKKHVTFILPVAGRAPAFLRFTQTLGGILKRGRENIDIILVMYKDPKGLYQSQVQQVDRLKTRFPHLRVKILYMQETFARGKALQFGVNVCRNDSLILLLDVDMAITETFLHRIRLFTIQGRQAYFPIYFSQFDPVTICRGTKNCRIPTFDLNNDAGLWRYFGFGMVTIYKSDFLAAGGYDMKIEGWGKEDIDFYELCLRSNLSVVRAPDPALVHVYHPKHCSRDLDPTQYEMCLGSKSGIYGSVHKLSSQIYDTPQILHSKIPAKKANKRI